MTVPDHNLDPPDEEVTCPACGGACRDGAAPYDVDCKFCDGWGHVTPKRAKEYERDRKADIGEARRWE